MFCPVAGYIPGCNPAKELQKEGSYPPRVIPVVCINKSSVCFSVKNRETGFVLMQSPPARGTEKIVLYNYLHFPENLLNVDNTSSSKDPDRDIIQLAYFNILKGYFIAMILQQDMAGRGFAESTTCVVSRVGVFASFYQFAKFVAATFVFQYFDTVEPMFDMVVRVYFQYGCVPLANPLKRDIFAGFQVVQACQGAATRIGGIEFGVGVALVVQQLVFYTESLTAGFFFFGNKVFDTAIGSCT